MARASVSRIQAAEVRRYQAEEDLRTLRRAEEIRGDHGRVLAAKRIAKSEMRALGKIAGRGASKKR